MKSLMNLLKITAMQTQNKFLQIGYAFPENNVIFPIKKKRKYKVKTKLKKTCLNKRIKNFLHKPSTIKKRINWQPLYIPRIQV